MKKKVSVVIGIFFIMLMFGSTIAYTFLTALRSEGTKEQISLPAASIVYQELEEKVENYAVSKGRTVIKLYFNALCTGCAEQRTYLEQVTNQNSGLIILEELTENNATAPKVLIRSQRGSEELLNVTNNALFNSLCDLMTKQPIECALKNV